MFGHRSDIVREIGLFAVYSTNQEVFQIYDPAALRNEATVQLTMPAYSSGNEVHVWGTMISSDRKVTAISSYMGTAVVN